MTAAIRALLAAAWHATADAAPDVASKATIGFGAFGVVYSFLEKLPSGVALSLGGIALSLGINAFFRWLGHRRDTKLRQIEHDAYMKRLSERNTAGAPLS